MKAISFFAIFENCFGCIKFESYKNILQNRILHTLVLIQWIPSLMGTYAPCFPDPRSPLSEVTPDHSHQTIALQSLAHMGLFSNVFFFFF
jgi:hypothetical protein